MLQCFGRASQRARDDPLLCTASRANVKNANQLKPRSNVPFGHPELVQIADYSPAKGSAPINTWSAERTKLGCSSAWRIRQSQAREGRSKGECVLESPHPGPRSHRLLRRDSEGSCSPPYRHRNSSALESRFCRRKRLIKPRTNPWTQERMTAVKAWSSPE